MSRLSQWIFIFVLMMYLRNLVLDHGESIVEVSKNSIFGPQNFFFRLSRNNNITWKWPFPAISGHFQPKSNFLDLGQFSTFFHSDCFIHYHFHHRLDVCKLKSVTCSYHIQGLDHFRVLGPQIEKTVDLTQFSSVWPQVCFFLHHVIML